jgi:hypothetical protein
MGALPRLPATRAMGQVKTGLPLPGVKRLRRFDRTSQPRGSTVRRQIGNYVDTVYGIVLFC